MYGQSNQSHQLLTPHLNPIKYWLGLCHGVLRSCHDSNQGRWQVGKRTGPGNYLKRKTTVEERFKENRYADMSAANSPFGEYSSII